MDIPRSFIKNVALQISNKYRFDNSPYSDNGKPKKPIPFIGRQQPVEKFLEFLNGNEKKGVFLVTGYKGMGKTSFVNHVINEYKNHSYINEQKKKEREKSHIITIHLTLTQNNPKEIDILRLLVSSIYEKRNIYRYRGIWLRVSRIQAKTWLHWFRLVVFFWIAFAISGTITNIRDCILPNSNLGLTDLGSIQIIISQIPGFRIVALLICYLAMLFFKGRAVEEKRHNSPQSMIIQLMERCYSALSEENTSDDDFSIGSIKAKFGGSEKRTKSYPIADTKQIEFELQQFLKSLTDDAEKKRIPPIEFIFIFDELDKIESLAPSSFLSQGFETIEGKEADISFEQEMRQRKQAIVNIIAGLKSFFTTAPARFIFIAGREMFDASLADIADRQSSISSIFTFIFNIESLLKENELGEGSNRASLSTAIELYLKKLLFADPEEQRKLLPWYIFVLQRLSILKKQPALEKSQPEPKSLFVLAKERYSCKEPEEIDPAYQFGKLRFMLQSFVTFLTYRSNGSPQKLIKTIHEFILVKQNFNDDGGKNLIFNQAENPSHLYLHFNYENQYRIGFINYLYKPIAVKRGRAIKLYSDNIVVATPYLFDHLLKFHPFAFSLEHLETIPEVLSTNKTPFLRQHIRMLIDHLGASHVRETEIGLFEYKFYSRTINEIAFLSKMFEPEAAAFNFTLDEAYLVKRHIGNKIKGLRNTYHKFLGESDVDYRIPSISHLSQILGDLHFFDEEYDEAITAYSDAIKALGRLTVGEQTDMRDFVSLIKNKLKLGLCFEKTNAYEEALANYADCCNDAKKFLAGRLIKGIPFDIDNLKEYNTSDAGKKNGFKDLIFYASGLSNLLQMVLQGYLAKIFLQEKIGIEGVSNLKLSIAIGSFLKMFDGFIAPENRNHLLKANAYIFIGKLWYFKNNLIDFELNESINKRKKIVPGIFLKRITAVIENNHSFINNPTNRGRKSQFKPVSALSAYVISFHEVVSAKYDGAAVEIVKKFIRIDNSLAGTMPNDSLVKTLIRDAENLLFKEKDSKFTVAHYRYIATLLSNIGDCLLGSYKTAPRKHNKLKIRDLFKDLTNPDWHKLEEKGLLSFLEGSVGNTFNLTDVLKCYYLSGRYFLKHGRKISCSFQYNKILHVLRIVLTHEGIKGGATEITGYDIVTKDQALSEYIGNFLTMLKKSIVNPLLEIASETSGNIDTHEIQKATSDNGITDVRKAYALNNVSYQQETREPVLLYNYISLKVGVAPSSIYINKLISPYNSMSTQYSRMIELDFYAKYCELNIKVLRFKKSQNEVAKKKAIINNLAQEVINTIVKEGNSITEDLEREIVNCLFSRFTMVRILEIYNANYAIGYRYLAYTHNKIAEVIEQNPTITGLDNKVKDKLNNWRGFTSFTSIDRIYHYQRAKEYFEKTIQLHSGGKEYKKMMSDMIYLEDDFNDNAYHFGAALDRYFITNGVFEKQLKECNKAITGSPNYLAEAYL